MKRKLIFIMILSLSFFILAGAKEKTKLVLWSYMDNQTQQQELNALCKQFSNSQNDIEITFEYIPFGDLKKQLTIGFAAGKMPDVVLIDNPDHAAFSAMGIFADLTDKIKNWPEKDKYFPGPWKSTVYNGRNYGIPFVSNCLALFYNVEMLKKAGVKPPTNWDELKIAAKKLTGNGTYGLAISAVKTEEGTFQFLPWLISTGAIVDKPGTKEGIKSFEYLTGLIKDGSMSKEVISWVQADVMKQFIAGKAAMMVNGPWNIPDMKKDAPNMKWDVVKIPKDKVYTSVLGGENMAILKGKNEDAAWKFLQFIGKPETVKDYAVKFNMFPPRKDVASDKYWTSDPIIKIFMDEMQYAMPRGPHPKWPEISNALSTALQESLTQIKTPDKAAKDAQDSITNSLK
jgi:multiple sugar transport system substrate-binding protein